MGYYVNVEPGVRIYVEDVNPMGRHTIVFIHGWPLNHHMFEYQFNHFPMLGYRCIGIDLRGFGHSDKPVSGYHYDRMADDLHQIIQALRLANFTLLAHSMGGAIAIRYMSRHGGQGVCKLVLVAAAAPIGFTQATAHELLTKTYQDRPNMLQGVTDTFFFQYITDRFSDWFFDMGLEAAGWSTAATTVSLRDENLMADLDYIHVPTLLIHGIHDKVIPFTQAAILQARIKGSCLVPFEFSGHGTFWEEKDKFNEIVTQFIQ